MSEYLKCPQCGEKIIDNNYIPWVCCYCDYSEKEYKKDKKEEESEEK